MELTTTGIAPTPEEQAAVDAAIGPVATDSGGRVAREGLRAARERRHLLLPALLAVQQRIGWVSREALDYVCERLLVPLAEAYGVATFYSLIATEPRPPLVLHVCDDVACLARGAGRACEELERRWGPEGSGDKATWHRSPCLGRCDTAPAALLQRAGPGLGPALEHVTAGPLESLLRGADPHPSVLGSHRSTVAATRPRTAALHSALTRGPEGVIAEVEASGLVGRGGAAFPTGRKWAAVAGETGRKYVVANGDESEPGTFKDRKLMGDDPFAVIEAMTIAGFAVGAEHGLVYVRGEYPEAAERLEEAVTACRASRLLGDDVAGAGFAFDVEIRRGGGAYVCGEETALFESVEGRRGEPRSKPPFPTSVGLFGRPTLVNNVETLLAVAGIVEEGAAAHRAVGTAGSPGHKLFCVSGSVRRPAVLEVEFGIRLGELVDRAGGLDPGRSVVAILLGGAAGSFVGRESLDLELSYEGVREAGLTLGSGAVVVFDDTVDLGPVVARIARFFREESCGQCVPCRVGTVRQEESLRRLLAGGDLEAEDAHLADLERAMRDASICGLGQMAGSAVRSALRLGLVPGGRP
ncbi:MAG: NAD(P)H-dependent oxidoreductase subunit E [Acidimicrobiia bacterium]